MVALRFPPTPFVTDSPLNGGRLTAENNVARSVSNQLAKTDIHYTPDRHNQISLFDGVHWLGYNFAQLTHGVPAVADTIHDTFIFLSNFETLEIEPVAWTNDTTRAVALGTQDGRLIKSGDATKLYVGTFRTTSIAGQCEDSEAKRFVWNHYNRIPRKLKRLEATASWPYATLDTWRQANAAIANRVETVSGLDDAWLDLSVRVSAQHSVAGSIMSVGIGIDSTTVNSADVSEVIGAPVANDFNAGEAKLKQNLAIGYHALNWLEITDAATATFFGTHVSGGEDYSRSGLEGYILG